MEIKGDFFVLLHSKSQNGYLVDTMSGMVMKNMEAFIKGLPSDYYVLAMADTEESLNRQKEKLIKLRDGS